MHIDVDWYLLSTRCSAANPNDGTERWTDGQTDTQPLHRPVYYVGSASKTITTTEAANKENKKVKFNKFSYRSVFCRRPRQSNERILAFLDRKNSVTSLRRLVLGAKQPVISHISSQPRSSLALQHQNTAICAMPCTLLTLTITNNEWSKNFNKSPHCPALVTPSWRHGIVVSGVRQWTKLTHVGPCYNWDEWPSSGGYTISGCNQPTRSTQPCIPPGSLNRVPASAGVKAGMSPLPGGGCDPIWHVSSRRGEASSELLYSV